MRVEIKFAPDMALAAITGVKICTSRSEVKGSPGDTFIVEHEGYFPREKTIIDVIECRLEFIRDHLYRLEGFNSPEEFEVRWKQLHRGHFNPDSIKQVHFFSEVVI